jgi:hypothetical protein
VTRLGPVPGVSQSSVVSLLMESRCVSVSKVSLLGSVRMICEYLLLFCRSAAAVVCFVTA